MFMMMMMMTCGWACLQVGVCGRCVTSAFDCVRWACRVVSRRSQPVSSPAATTTTTITSTTAHEFHQTAAAPRGERKCGDGVDSACVAQPSPSHHATVVTAQTHAPAATTAAATDDVINCCSDDDDTLTSSVAADCVTESSALT